MYLVKKVLFIGMMVSVLMSNLLVTSCSEEVTEIPEEVKKSSKEEVSEPLIYGCQMKTIAGRKIFYLKKDANHEQVKSYLKRLSAVFQEMDKAIPEKRLAWAKRRKYWIRSNKEMLIRSGMLEIPGWYAGKDDIYYPLEMRGHIFLNALTLLKEVTVSSLTSLIFHETAHAFHDQFVGNDNQDVIQTYKNAKKYAAENDTKEINTYRYFQNEAYITANHFEYFAESTVNVFYFYPPKGRGTDILFYLINEDGTKRLIDYSEKDPEGYQMILKYWE